MEADDSKQPSVSKASSFSPKVTRPKLPPFAGIGSKTLSPRSKTDPGRGEIKEIMEDIMNLKKTDWKTFSRSKASTLPKGKSVSTNSSPSASPLMGSPAAADDQKSILSRDRSRSLKALTDRLLNKSPKLAATEGPKQEDTTHKRATPTTSTGKRAAASRKESRRLSDLPDSSQTTASRTGRSPEKHSTERMHDKILESAEDIELEEAEGTKSVSSDESFRTVPEFVTDDSQTSHEKSPDFEYLVGEHDNIYDSDGGVSRRSQEEYSQVKILDEESLAEGEDHPVVGSYIYHPIPRNSKFLQLAATQPSKRFPAERRSGITMLATRGKLGSLGQCRDDEGRLPGEQQEDIAPRPKSKHKSESTKSRKSSARFISHHPPINLSPRSAEPACSSDLITFKSSPGSDDELKQINLAGDQLRFDIVDNASYMIAPDWPVAYDTVSDLPERRNSNLGQDKSKSDFCGGRGREEPELSVAVEAVQGTSASIFSPEDTETSTNETFLSFSDDETTKRQSEDCISFSNFKFGDDVEEGHKSVDEEDMAAEDYHHGSSDRSTPDSEAVLNPANSLKLPSSSVVSVPAVPQCPSPSPILTPERPSVLLNVPTAAGTGRKSNIFRSASSASVFQHRKPGGSPLRDKDVVRKYSITSDEAMTNSKSSANLVPDFLPIGDTGNASSMPAVWNKERIYSTDSPEREPGFVKDKRYHIVEELYRNEKEYVEALRTLKDKYMVPLKTQSSVDDHLVDNIFYMIPEILTHHSVYLDFLDSVWRHWDPARSTVGNIITTIFGKQTVLESYMSFVENYKASGKVIEHALTTKTSVQRFIEQCQKDSGSKLTMKDLIVRPIQRIPRYELLIQRLLDNTPRDHPDQPLLQQACRVMHELAVKLGTINDSQHEEDMQQTLKKLELLLITDLAVPDRAYIRHDMVQLFNKKDQCCIWLFSDVIIISSIKRKSGPVTRKVSIILKTPLGQDFAENIKHKVWLRVGLDDLEIVKTQGSLLRKPTVDKEQIEEDLSLMTQMAELAARLSCQHQGLDEALKDMSSHLSRQLSEASSRGASVDSNKLELLVTTQEGVLHLVIGFPSAEKRSSWESVFTDAKQKLALLSDKRAPEFLQPLQITKTRAGMQFSCAAAIDGINASGHRDVWVCNSDGYVGHMCLLSLQPEPIVTLNTPVPGCNARILCICAVAAFSGAFRRRTSQKGTRTQRGSLAGSSIQEGPLIIQEGPLIIQESPLISVDRAEEEFQSTERIDSAIIETPTSPAATTSTSTDDVDTSDAFHEEGYQSDTDSSDDEPVSFMSGTDELFVGDFVSDEDLSRPQVSELTESSPDPITSSGSWDQDPSKSTMWLGTEDGCIHIFQSCDNIKTTKNKLKIQHGSPVHCIIYLDNKVFVSLFNGDLIVYKRDQEGLWDTDCPYTRSLGTPSSPITRMLAVAGKLWCGCQNHIYVVNPLAFNVETSFQVTPDASRSVQCLVSSGQGVWLASNQSSKVMLFHAVTYEFLLEVSIAQAVSNKLQSADDIIRQHKAACLRITALLVCKDLLWVGTSAGVILTIPIPRITSTSTRGCLAVPTVTGLVHGHTGHVRFLTSVEMSGTPGTKVDTSREATEGSASERHAGFSVHDIHRRSSMAATTATMASRMLVISGGDGYEDFRSSAANEGAGRDDSTNHLLLWQV